VPASPVGRMGAPPPPSTVAMQRIHKTLHVLRTDNEPQVRGGYTSESVRGHAWAPPTHANRSICRTKVLANDRACTRDGKEGVDGSSPSEGFSFFPA
jgi:hypothetical protein